jgi:hypothetical protein
VKDKKRGLPMWVAIVAVLSIFAVPFGVAQWASINAPNNISVPQPTAQPTVSNKQINEDFDAAIRAAGGQPNAEAPAKEVMVHYEVDCTNFSVTYTDETGDIQQHTACKDHWGLQFKAKPGQFLSLSSQNNNDWGSVRLRISVNDEEVKTAEGVGPYAIGTCSYTIP